ncbi:MAG: 3D domain-containing protein [Planctomycetota bacterium]|nr:3D domain-containing protein [Planctomycetota bacterium]
MGAGVLVHSGYRALQERTRPVALMAMDDPFGGDAEASSTRPPTPLTLDPVAPEEAEAPVAPPLPAPGPGTPARPAAAPSRSHAAQVRFDDRPIRKVGSVRMLVTAYSPDKRSCGPNARGITASGMSVWTNGMQLVAADTRLLPFGSLIAVPGYNQGKPVPVLDRGGAIKGRRIDVLFPTHEQANAWGKRYVTITVWDYAD